MNERNDHCLGESTKEIIIDDSLRLVPYYPNPEVTLKWYQDLEVCRQVDHIDRAYTRDRLDAMYAFLSSHGECYYVQFRGILVGDVSLFNKNELAIVISKEYQNRHIGRKCIRQMLILAKEKGLKELRAKIYAFNHQSQRMFESLGFKQVDEELYIYRI